MMRFRCGGLVAVCLGMLCVGPVALADGGVTRGVVVAVPSGAHVEWLQSQTDASGPDGLTLRHFFLAPDLAREDPDVALTDMQALCEQFALPHLSSVGPQPQQIVISLSDRPVAFGDSDPEATQLFAGYAISPPHCVEEMF
ncbi:DUF6497 family protein [Thioclava litoralis]|uniref:DUF6497 family protein n=1 Tax=Thioclava litoralis TaxID=3076557 RepID=A0ABZ1DY01_9RHOB|nr:DUF6497 family protein [Thioclava sp. FTW29]